MGPFLGFTDFTINYTKILWFLQCNIYFIHSSFDSTSVYRAFYSVSGGAVGREMRLWESCSQRTHFLMGQATVSILKRGGWGGHLACYLDGWARPPPRGDVCTRPDDRKGAGWATHVQQNVSVQSSSGRVVQKSYFYLDKHCPIFYFWLHQSESQSEYGVSRALAGTPRTRSLSGK